MKRSGCLGLLALLLSVCLAACSAVPAGSTFTHTTPERTPILTAETVNAPAGAPEGMERIATKGYVAMYADTATGYFAVEDLRTGTVWHSNPIDRENNEYGETIYKNWLYSQVVLTVINPETSTLATKNSYIASLKKDGVTVTVLEDGLRVTYDFVKEEVGLAVDYRLTEDGFTATVDPSTITETGENQIYNVKILPLFGGQYFGTEGWIMVPDGSGAMIAFDDDRALSMEPYRRKVYGNDPVIPSESKQNFQESLHLPMTGLHTASGGLLLIADEGAANAYANGMCSRQLTGYSGTYFDFDLRISQDSIIGDVRSWNYKQVVTYQKGELGCGVSTVRYVLLTAEESTLAGMAKVARTYLLSRRQTHTTVTAQAPVFLKVLMGSREQKSILGVPVTTVRALTTLEQANGLVERLNKAGVSGIQMSLQEWGKSLLKGKVTTKIDLHSALGNKAELDALAKTLTGKGGRLYLQTALNLYTSGGNGVYKNRSAIRDVNGAVSEQPRYPRDIYYPATNATTDRLLNAFVAAKKAAEFQESLLSSTSGVGMDIAELGSILGGDYAKTGLRRQDAEELYANTLSELAGKAATLGSGGTNLYALYDLVAVYELPENASEYGVISRSVPFLQLTLRGIMPVGGRAINASGNYTQQFLACIATGMAPTYELIADMPQSFKGLEVNGYYGADMATWEPLIAEQYAVYAQVYTATYGAEITAYEWLQTDVVRVVYGNGVEVLVNFSNQAFTYGETTVEAQNFVLNKGGETE